VKSPAAGRAKNPADNPADSGKENTFIAKVIPLPIEKKRNQGTLTRIYRRSAPNCFCIVFDGSYRKEGV
jgi:hypothetical protein